MTRFAIISMGRSGSTYLSHLLNSHPDVLSLGELVSPHTWYADCEDMDIHTYLEQRWFKGADVAGFKMPWQPITKYPDVWGVFWAQGYRLIHLRRRNKLDHFLSVKLAQKNNEWSSEVEYPDQSVEIDPNHLLGFINSSTFVDTTLRTMCERGDHLAVDYEDLVQGRGHDKLQEFLGVDCVNLAPATIRARRLSRGEAISNFAVLNERFATGPIRQYLDEPELL